MVFLFAGVMFLVLVVGTWGVIRAKRSSEDPSTYYAVFLSNTQVYFGTIANSTRRSIVLDNIYYLQQNEPIQSTTPTEEKGDGATNSPLSLIKLGEEIHGPADRMIINRDHVLFMEPLRSDSRVVSAIETYQHSKK